jgi:CRP-like cAMP-binding protein
VRSACYSLAQLELPLDVLRNVECFHELSDADLARISPLINARKVKARSSFVMGRDFADRVLFALSGQFRVVAISPRADRITLKTVLSGGAIGHVGAILGHAAGAVERLFVDESGVLLEMARTDFTSLIYELPLLSIAVLRCGARLDQEAECRIYELGALNVRERLQAELLRLARPSAEAEGEWVVSPAPTHEALGASIATGRDAISRHISQLSRMGLIRIGYRSITIIDVARFRELDRAIAGNGFAQAEETRALA